MKEMLLSRIKSVGSDHNLQGSARDKRPRAHEKQRPESGEITNLSKLTYKTKAK